MSSISSPLIPPSAKAVLKGSFRDLGGFSVRRVLPADDARHVGPFIFFDQFLARAGVGVDVRPHPHIGLATVTYLFEGSIMHRDSLGSKQLISPGDVNWMTAGRGIVHSERTPRPEEERVRGSSAYGIQMWIALPLAHEDTEPSFEHHPSSTIPQIERNGVTLRIIVGTAFGKTSPTKTFSQTLYVAAAFQAGGSLKIQPEHEERGVYLVEGDITIDGVALETSHMAVLKSGETVNISSLHGARVMLLGGDKLDGERFIEWNFVSSSKEKIEKAKIAWMKQELGKVPGETEWIPLPEKNAD